MFQHSEIYPCFLWSQTRFGYEGQTEEERNLRIYKDKHSTSTLMKRSRRQLSIDMVIHRSIFESN